jgi:2-hydroxy-3-keto-5-methylthiopentenyl-1-phosphate phosphatase
MLRHISELTPEFLKALKEDRLERWTLSSGANWAYYQLFLYMLEEDETHNSERTS